MTDKPFGVNLTFLPTVSTPPGPEDIQAIVEGAAFHVSALCDLSGGLLRYSTMLPVAGGLERCRDTDRGGFPDILRQVRGRVRQPRVDAAGAVDPEA